MRILYQIEEIALDFGRRFSATDANDPIKCPAQLREMVVAAAIGSGVRYELAKALARTLLEDPSAERIALVSSRHRFPNQAKMRLTSIFADDESILKRTIAWLYQPECVFINRRLMSQLVPGLGPKQTSFLFSCSGYGQQIAVLDRHILKYLQLLGVIEPSDYPASWKRYEEVESRFLLYSERKSVRPDALDLAIWITMKAAGRRVLECA